ncbi:hypothetical protein BD309DRAFT_970208, partial [Dichomitus squalens]
VRAPPLFYSCSLRSQSLDRLWIITQPLLFLSTASAIHTTRAALGWGLAHGWYWWKCGRRGSAAQEGRSDKHTQCRFEFSESRGIKDWSEDAWQMKSYGRSTRSSRNGTSKFCITNASEDHDDRQLPDVREGAHRP